MSAISEIAAIFAADMLAAHRKVTKRAVQIGAEPRDILAASISAHSGLFAKVLASSVVSGAINVEGFEAIMAQMRADFHAEIRGGQKLNS